MSHTAFVTEVIAEVPKRSWTPESFDSWGDQLYVGASDRSLVVFKPSSENSNEWEERSTTKKFASRPITQMTIIDGLDVMIAASEHSVIVYQLPSLHEIGTLDTAGKPCVKLYANQACRSRLPDPMFSYEICISTKTDLICYKWNEILHGFKQTQIYAMPSTVYALVWAGTQLFVGFRAEYNFIDCVTGAVSDVSDVGYQSVVAQLLSVPGYESAFEDIVFYLANSQGHFVDFDGQPAAIKPLSYKASPDAVGFSYPYILGLLKDRVDIRNLQTDTCALPVKISGPKFISSKTPLPDSEYHCVYVASNSRIICLKVVPVLQQVEALVAAKSFEIALELCDGIRNQDWEQVKNERVHQIHTLYGYHLFNQRQYFQAIEQFRGHCHPITVLSLFPAVFPPGQDRGIIHPVPITRIHDSDLSDALESMIPYLYTLRSRLGQPDQKYPGHGLYSEVNDDMSAPADRYETKSNPLMPLPVLIDTMLLHAYLITDDELVKPLLEPSNQCDLYRTETLLLKFEKHPELSYFYKTRGLHEKALDLLRRLGNVKSKSPLYGPGPTIEYLQDLVSDSKYAKLVFTYSSWVLKMDGDQGLQIFTNCHSKKDFQLDRSIPSKDVVSHLSKYTDVYCLIGYLESLLDVAGSIDSEMHDLLINLYVKQILTFSLPDPSSVHAGDELGQLGILRKKLLRLLRSSRHYTPEIALSKFPHDNLLEERTVLLSRIGNYKKALEIIVKRLEDFDLALNFCSEHYSLDNEHTKDLYSELLTVYLSGDSPDLENAIRVLNTRPECIDISTALNILPPSTPISKLLSFYERAIGSDPCSQIHVAKYLRKAENLDVQLEYFQRAVEGFVVDDNSTCALCDAALGRGAVFVRYPNGVLIDYKCYAKLSNKHECPVTHTKFTYY